MVVKIIVICLKMVDEDFGAHVLNIEDDQY